MEECVAPDLLWESREFKCKEEYGEFTLKQSHDLHHTNRDEKIGKLK